MSTSTENSNTITINFPHKSVRLTFCDITVEEARKIIEDAIKIYPRRDKASLQKDLIKNTTSLLVGEEPIVTIHACKEYRDLVLNRI